MRPFHLALLGTSFLIPAACDGGEPAGPAPPPGLEIESLTPAPDATDVETGATVAVVFSKAIDPATLNSETFKVSTGGTALATALSYDAATRTARAAAPFLPDGTYEVEVTTGVRTPADSGLSEARQWTFNTRSWQAVTVDAAGAVGGFNSLAIDATGRLHVSYDDGTNGDLKYATCAAICETAGNWQTVTVDAGGDVGVSNSLAVDGVGGVHAAHYDRTNGDLKYASCDAICEVAANWQTVTVDAAEDVGSNTSLAVDATERLHVSYYDLTNEDLKYATCATTCEVPANWQTVTVDAAGKVGLATSLSVDAMGRVHVSYRDVTNARLKYATCATGCEVTGNWQTVTADDAGEVAFTSLAVDYAGRLHVSYYDSNNADLKYATCATGCDAAGSWQVVAVDAAGDVGHSNSLAVDATGRVHVSYRDFTNGDALKYATCATGCEAAGNWQVATLEAAGDVGGRTSLAVDARGRIHVSYRDFSNQDLRHIE